MSVYLAINPLESSRVGGYTCRKPRAQPITCAILMAHHTHTHTQTLDISAKIQPMFKTAMNICYAEKCKKKLFNGSMKIKLNQSLKYEKSDLKVCDDGTLVQILYFWTLSIVLFLSKTPSCLYVKT
jgi:hypothetical protein